MNGKTIKVKHLRVENPQYSPGIFWFSLIVAVLIELLIVVGVV